MLFERLDRHEPAAVLLGHLRDDHRAVTWTDPEEQRLGEAAAGLRPRLGDAAFGVLRRQGTSTPARDAIDFAKAEIGAGTTGLIPSP